MNNTEIHEDETLEDLQIGGLKLLQKKNGFRFPEKLVIKLFLV